MNQTFKTLAYACSWAKRNVGKIICTVIAGVSVFVVQPAHAVVLDLTSAGAGGVTEATGGATAALPIFAVLVALTLGVMGFRKLRKG